MNTEDIVLAAYHRAIRRHERSVGVQYPVTGVSRVDITKRGGVVYDTSMYSPQKLATFTFDSLDRPRIRLV